VRRPWRAPGSWCRRSRGVLSQMKMKIDGEQAYWFIVSKRCWCIEPLRAVNKKYQNDNFSRLWWFPSGTLTGFKIWIEYMYVGCFSHVAHIVQPVTMV
jgi:hypothetical protein